MAYSQDDLDKVRALRVKGVGSVTLSDGRRIEYRPDVDLRQLESDIVAALNLSAGTPRRAWRAVTSKG